MCWIGGGGQERAAHSPLATSFGPHLPAGDAAHVGEAEAAPVGGDEGRVPVADPHPGAAGLEEGPRQGARRAALGPEEGRPVHGLGGHLGAWG